MSSKSFAINTPSSPSKVDVNGTHVRFRIVELEVLCDNFVLNCIMFLTYLQRCIQALLKTCPDVVDLPLVRNFLEVIECCLY